jgi:hypothetical protein
MAARKFTIIGILSLDWNLMPSRVVPPTRPVSGQQERGEAVARVQAAQQDEGRMIDVTGVKVFSATKAKERELLGELITDWIRSHPDHEIVDKIVTQSSDSEFHCLTITLFYKHNKA